MKYLLGYDVGSSFIKAALLDAGTGKIIASVSTPDSEMQIHAPSPGYAEQEPATWWREIIHATHKIREQVSIQSGDIIAIGISYQMHGLVCIDKRGESVRPAIIWCDSRAADIGDRAFREMGTDYCLEHFLNSPGNFTASKLKWVKENEPQIFEKVHAFFLPGDYIAMKMTGEIATTISGLSEGILWDYHNHSIADSLLEHYELDKRLLAPVVPVFGEQGKLRASAAVELGLDEGIPVCYRAGDQPNNAYSLNALEPGEVAATAGTSGVVYGVTDKAKSDPQSRVNPFVHVNHSRSSPRFGVLLCVNGTGSLNSWLRNQLLTDLSYDQMNWEASKAPIGSDGLHFFPFGNGAERILENRPAGAVLSGLQFNRHQRAHIARAAQEGIVFALNYGMEIMNEMGIPLHTIRACRANMFLSDVFGSTFANVSGCALELYNTDGATGAARAAGVGAGYYRNYSESFTGMKVIKRTEPQKQAQQQTAEAYAQWKLQLLSEKL